jgi:hypothetical protein
MLKLTTIYITVSISLCGFSGGRIPIIGQLLGTEVLKMK